MAETYSTLTALFADIANAIREKTGEANSIIADDFPDIIRNRLDIFINPIKPDEGPYLTFSSPNSFTLKVNDTTKHWDGTLEYSTDTSSWSIWDGVAPLSSATSENNNVLHLRGTNNTKITGHSMDYKWVLTGSNISCSGNIENLLDYATVQAGGHPTMASYCYYSMFEDCTNLITAPRLPATALNDNCYERIFRGCTALTTAPELLPAMRLTRSCYSEMFYGCTNLVTAPTLPATTLAEGCYQDMFNGCTSLVTAPTVAQASPLLRYCLLLSWPPTAISTCFTTVQASPPHQDFQQPFQRAAAMTTCSTAARASPLHLHFPPQKWSITATVKCSTIAQV